MSKGKLIFNGKDGWSYERDGRTYDLLEGMSLEGHSTSALCFVMETDENGYKDFTTWFCCDGLTPEELLKTCDEYITGEPTAEQQVETLQKEVAILRNEIIQLKNTIKHMKSLAELLINDYEDY